VCSFVDAVRFYRIILKKSGRRTRTTTAVTVHGFRAVRVIPTSRHRSAYRQQQPTIMPHQRRNEERQRRDRGVLRRVQSGEDDDTPTLSRLPISFSVFDTLISPEFVLYINQVFSDIPRRILPPRIECIARMIKIHVIIHSCQGRGGSKPYMGTSEFMRATRRLTEKWIEP
jgi:hypothetical protein